MMEGTVVVVLSKLNERIRSSPDGLVVGTFIGYLNNKKVMVLLPDTNIFIGEEYEIALYVE
jgi:hypothetical protein